MVKPTRERVREWREKKAKKGGRSLSVWLEPETARMLHELLSHYGETASPLIARAIGTLYDSAAVAPLSAESAPAQQPQPSVPEREAVTESSSTPSTLAVPPPAAQETPPPVADSPPPVQEEPSPMLEPSPTAVESTASAQEVEPEAAPEQKEEVLNLTEEPPAEQVTGDEEDPLLKEIQDQLARGVPFRKLHRSLLLDWLKTMQAQGVSFQAMAEKLNAAGIPTLAGSGRWEQGMIPTVLLLSAGSANH